MANFKTALKLGIPAHQVAETLYSLARESCDFRKAKIYDKQLSALTEQITDDKGSSYETLFTNLIRLDDPRENLAAAHRTASNIQTLLVHSPHPFSHYSITAPHKRIRIGYLSQEFHNHPVTFQIIDLFKCHDKNKYEVFVYSYGINNQSPLRRQIELNAEHFIDLVTVDHQQIAARIHKDKIDILVDLDGFSGFARKDIVAYRPAPIQINYLGFPGTSGTSYIDYLLADTIIVPPEEQIYYSETIFYLPHCYQLCSPHKISRQKFTRADFGLPPDAFVFCSFNRPFKISEDIFDAWIQVLKKVQNSVLWLYSDELLTQKNLRSFFKKSGLSPDRLIFTGKLPMDKHLARLKLADLALDTHIYSGGATTANLLWAGVPVITIYGRHYLSRMSSSIITNIGLPELVTKDLSEYKRLAIDLATHPKKMVALKQKLAKNRLISPLFNSKLFVKNLERLYQQVFSDYLHQAKNGHKI
jgi:predicted O-linked N-acetylglucosamine transferase (SPINDLY family)